MLFHTVSSDDTTALGTAMGALLQPGDIVLLRGDLGAGKSVLARALARGVGITQAMPSPTFTLMQPYRGRIPFYHFDLYRLDDPDQFYEAGLDEFVGGDGAAVIEWPDCADLDPSSALHVSLSRLEDDDARAIELTHVGMEDRIDEFYEALKKWSVQA